MDKWIPVSEAMPEPEVAVLAFWESDDKSYRGCFGVAKRLNKRGIWCDADDTENEFCDPSHWMPLPEPPK
jgi:uncharacterized protein DUF551